MAISRKNFLKNLAIGTASIPFILSSCSSDDDETVDNSGSGSGTTDDDGSGTTGNDTCALAPTETEGPFPTHNPSSYVRTDIRDDREGVEMSVSIQINDQSNDCSPMGAGIIVDIWHCDADGNYSEYGGIPMQTTNYTDVHFLRGRQTTDSDGKVSFTTIFPGWYQSRATHIHVHIYDANGNSLKITQISFPEGDGSAVELVNSSAGESYGYTNGMSGYTYNAGDNVFSDDDDNVEMATVSGSLTDGFELSHNINI